MSSFENAGQNVGLEIWRIEKFEAVPWPKEHYGMFYRGDSYIVLHTFQKSENNKKLYWDVHFWLGSQTSQDEMGTAAIKTVQLDDLLHGIPVQHREVEGHESQEFLQLFNGEIFILDGGIESGFNQVKDRKYPIRLLQIKAKSGKDAHIYQVPCKCSSLNNWDCFLLDAGLDIYTILGRHCSVLELKKVLELAQSIRSERRITRKYTVIRIEADLKEHCNDLYLYLEGNEDDIHFEKEDEIGENENEEDTREALFLLSDASGEITFTKVADSRDVSQFRSGDVMIYDNGYHIFVWIGKGANKKEKSLAMKYAQKYIEMCNRHFTLPVTRVLEGMEPMSFSL